MANLTTSYLGIPLKNPVMVGSSPFSKQIELAKLMEDQGVGAITMYSLFEEEVRHESLELDYYLNKGTESFAEALTYLSEPPVITLESDRYLEHLRILKETLSIPVIASLNGSTPGGWVRLAKQMEEAGADAIEMNLYLMVTDPHVSAEAKEAVFKEMIHLVAEACNIPVSIKLSPFYSSLPNFIKEADHAGVKGYVLFNRYLQPEFDIEKKEISMKARYSSSSDTSLGANWIAVLSPMVEKDFVLCNGVHTAEDIVRGVMAGASAAYMVSEFLIHGPRVASTVIQDLNAWMDTHEYADIASMKGLMAEKLLENSMALKRQSYMKALRSFNENLL